MARKERPKVSAKGWVEKSDDGYEATVFRVPKDRLFQPKKEGQYRLHIIPYTVPLKSKSGPNPNASPGEYYYERTFYVHRGIGANEQTFVCPKKTMGLPCPICEYREKLEKAKDADEDTIAALVPKMRQLWNVVDDEDMEEGVKVWEISFHNFGKQLKKEIRNGDEDEGYVYFADPDEGHLLRVLLEETSFGSGRPFLQTSSITLKKRKEKISDEILDGAYILDDELIVYPYDKLRKIFLQDEGGEEHGEEKEEPVARRRTEEKPEAKPEKKEEGRVGPTVASLGLAKGGAVIYDKKEMTILKIIDDNTVNLLTEDDEMIRGVDVAEVKPAPTKAPEPKNDKPAPKEEKAEKKPEPKKEPEPEPEDASAAEEDWDSGWD
jgi:hypothetical protein